MKKIISLLLVATMLVAGMLAAIPTAAAAAATVTATGSTNTTTNKVTVSFDLTNNPGMFSAMLTLGYNADALTVDTIKAGDAVWTTGEMADVNKTLNPMYLYFEGSSASENKTGNGTIATVVFNVKDKTKTYGLTLGYDPDNTIRITTAPNSEDVTLSLTNNMPTNYPAPATTTAPVTTEPPTTAAPDYTYLDNFAAEVLGFEVPAIKDLTKEQYDKICGFVDTYSGLTTEEYEYLQDKFPTLSDKFSEMNECYVIGGLDVDKAALDAIIAEIAALPEYKDMTPEQIDKMLELVDKASNLSDDDLTYIVYYGFDGLMKMAMSIGAYAEENDIDMDIVKTTSEAISKLPAFDKMSADDMDSLLKLDKTIKGFDKLQLAFLKLMYASDYETYTKLMSDYANYLAQQTTAPAATTTATATTKAPDSAKTGDSMIAFAAIAMLAALSCAAVVIVRKKNTSVK